MQLTRMFLRCGAPYGILVLTSVVPRAETIPITIVGKTQTQIVISYAAPSSATCTVAAMDNSGGPSVHDLDPNLFPNANLDLDRTYGNGFRWPTLTRDLHRTVFIGGHDAVDRALDGKWYSRALQTDARHTITVTCGADSGTVEAQTEGPKIGSNYPELPIPQADNPNPGYAAPTIDWSDRSVKYIDPITGVLLTRISGPADYLSQTNTGTSAGIFDFVYAPSRWTNADYARTNQNPATLASTSTPNAPLFLASNSAWFPYCCQNGITDQQVKLFAQGSNGSEIAEICWSEDSGQTCASGSLDTGALPTSAAVCSSCSLPSTYPTSVFGDWGTWTGKNGEYDLGNPSYKGINASGSVVTMSSLSGTGFNTDRPAGSQFTLSACSSGPDIQLTVAHVDSPLQITVTQTGLSNTNCTYQDYGSGVRVVLKNAGTLSFSATFNNASGYAANGGVNGYHDVCNIQKLTDIATDCDGNPQSPPLSGRLCQVAMASQPAIYLLQDNGRACLQSIGKNQGTSLYSLDNPWSGTKSYVAKDGSNNLWKVTKTTTDYTEYVPGTTFPTDGWNYTETATASSVASQITAAGGSVATALATGFWPALGVSGVIGGYVQYSSQGSQDTPCLRAMTDGSGSLKNTSNSFSKYPMRWGGCHSSPFGNGDYSNLTSNPLNRHDANAPLGGPFIAPITSIQKNGTFVTWNLPITGGTAGTATTLTSANHDLANHGGQIGALGGNYVTCSGGTGAWSTVNGTFQATVVDNNTFTLPVTTSGSFPGGITCVTAPPMVAASLSSASGNTITLDRSGYYSTFVPDNRNLFADGDPVGIDSYPTTQFYVKVTGYPAGQMGVFTNAALTTPATQTFHSGNHVMLAEACPSTDAASLMPNGKLYFDAGNLSKGVPLVRCVTVKLASEPCSHWPKAGEAAAYPCSANPSYSSLSNLQPGDVLYDVNGSDQPSHEHSLVLSVTVNSPTDINVTLMRRWGATDPNWVSDGGIPFCCAVHTPGWLPMAYITLPSLWIDATDPTAGWMPESPKYSGAHHDLGEGGMGRSGPLVNLAAPATPIFDDVVNVPFTTYLNTPVRNSHDNIATWQGDTANSAYSLPQQSYPSHRQATATGMETLWKADASAVNPDYGNPQGLAQNIVARTVTKVAGHSYVYQITTPAPSGRISIKTVPYLFTTGVKQFKDISGPADCSANPTAPNCITDSTLGAYCISLNANECVAGSTAGQAYFASDSFYDTGGNCWANNQTLPVPCLWPLSPMNGWLEQIRQSPIDYNGSGVRRLSMGWSLPLSQFSFYNWTSSADAMWGMFVANPIGGKTRFSPAGSAAFAMKLPPWPTAVDSQIRTSYVTIPVKLSGTTGDQVRISFGYGENGDPASLYCTTRQEACWTSSNATPSNPFVFAGEAQSKTPCDGGCTVSIPGIPGRVLFYQVERSNGSSTTLGPLESVVVP